MIRLPCLTRRRSIWGAASIDRDHLILIRWIGTWIRSGTAGTHGGTGLICISRDTTGRGSAALGRGGRTPAPRPYLLGRGVQRCLPQPYLHVLSRSRCSAV